MSTFPNPEDDPDFVGPLVDEAEFIQPSTDTPIQASAPDEDSEPDNPVATLAALSALNSPFRSLANFAREPSAKAARPILRRDGSVPAPRQPPPNPPPAAPSVPPGQAPDSLSLQQLKALVGGLPRGEPTPYAFVYGDAASLPEEIEEWFSYAIEERARIAKTHSSFGHEWSKYRGLSFAEGSGLGSSAHDWMLAPHNVREAFVAKLVKRLQEKQIQNRLYSLEALVYLALGCWHETSGLPSDNWRQFESGKQKSSQNHSAAPAAFSDKSHELNNMLESRYEDFGLQVEWIKRNVLMMLEIAGPQPFMAIFKSAMELEWAMDASRIDVSTVQREQEQRETWCAATLMYICLEVVRSCPEPHRRRLLRAELLKADPDFLVYLGNCINKVRWDESIQFPLVKFFLLFWKGALVLMGGLDEVEKAKESFQLKDPDRDKPTKPIITASPLDYHSFRQEITSKYPAYVPPASTFPLEPDQKSILPPLRNNTPRSTNGVFQPSTSQHGSSIMHQPVHIATPAPSPPPSPAAGKGGKKQNYQTNQLFPFLYPPLDGKSNELGGKGTTFLQDSLVGRKWEGQDIPSSILEASELFSARIRKTRALKQLWDERIQFLQHERGWVSGDEAAKDVASLNIDNDDVDELDLLTGQVKEQTKDSKKPLASQTTPHSYDGSVDDRLAVVEDFYRESLPHLQSTVMIVLRTILTTLSIVMSQPNGVTAASGLAEAANGGQATNGTDASASMPDVSNLSDEDLEALRTQEIAAKAASGVLILLIKWFKVSHILKFEYLGQLLLDSNFVQVILKLLQSQDVEKVVNCRTERTEINLFPYCRTISRNPPETLTLESLEMPEEESEDEAAPPPIKRRREEPEPLLPALESQPSSLPEVDELGIPISSLPSEPITSFSWRNFFSSINFLRILQKVCKNKAHRNLILVQYKSAAYLKKALKVPQRELRLYTLKLFKNQVPYCGRKWRQTNMKVITAVYLHCRPELRDDWLLSSDVDADVEQAVPMEQSLRALTHYYNIKRYPTQMGQQPDALIEQDFFARELDRLDWGDIDGGGGEEAIGEQNWEQGLSAEHL